MDTTQIILIAVLVLLLLGGGIALLSGRARRSGTAPPPEGGPRAAAGEQEAEGSEPAATAVAVQEPDTDFTAPADSQAGPTTTPERPESVAGRMQRLRDRLSRSGALGRTLLGLLSRDSLSSADWEEIEETLLLADLGPGPTDELMEALRTRSQVVGGADADAVRELLRTELLTLVDPSMNRDLATSAVLGDDGEPHPATILVVGVNGTGKTTTVGKLARVLVAQDKDVVLGAADTFRAAAADQLTTWGQRVGVPVVRSDRDGADPAAVAFDAVKAGREADADVVLVDTAGRLQNKAGLMDELGKIKRVIARQAPVAEVLLVLDATTGQNGLRQAQVFADVVDVTGIVLTKLDGTAKGGIVVAVQRELGVPVKFVGLGEGPDDLAPFDPKEFVDAIVS
ncbi:MAG: signal recognition particle-docking protein FtsY [Beutenbergiaceae bacterium]